MQKRIDNILKEGLADMNQSSLLELVKQAAEIRKSKKISQLELAKMIGVPQTRVSYLENGKNVTSNILFRYLEALGITLVIDSPGRLDDKNEC